MSPMRRYEFITLVGSVVVMPLIAGAQQRERTRRIGVLMSVASDDPKEAASHRFLDFAAYRASLGAPLAHVFHSCR